MSMSLMAKAMDIKVGNPLRKMVLLKLADNANDQGECWPSIPYIADKCEMSERSVQNHIKELEKDGLIKIEKRKNNNGLNQSNLFTLNLSGAGDSPYGAGDSPLSGAGDAPRTYHSLEPVNEPKNTTPLTSKVTKKINEFDLSRFNEKPSLEVWKDFMTHRKNLRAKLTQTAINALANQINIANSHGYSTDEVLSQIQMSGWRGFKFEWLHNQNRSRSKLEEIDHYSDWHRPEKYEEELLL